MPLEKKTISPQKTASMAKAQAASAAALQGTSPRARGVERTEIALLWVYRWGWTTPTLLELALRSSGRSGIGNRLVKNGLLVRTLMPGGGINNTPNCILTLSQAGLEHATTLATHELSYQINPLRIKPSTINHDETVQRLTAFHSGYWYNREIIESFLTEKELSVDKGKGDKIPDAIWTILVNEPQVNRTKVAIEVELSAKWGQELDTFVYQTLNQLSENLCDEIEIFAYSPALLARYAQAFKPGQMLQTWFKEPGKTGRWSKGSKVKIFPRQDNIINFTKITPLMLGR